MNYYIEKIVNLVRKFTMHSIDGVIYTNSKKLIEEYDTIFFYFNCPSLMHLGDHLYFKPLVVKLQRNNYKVVVEPIESIRFAFQNCLISQSFDLDPKKVLFVSRLELLPKIIDKFGTIDYFLYDTMSHKINLPISNFILNSFCEYYRLSDKFNLTIDARDYLDFVVKPFDKFNLVNKHKIIFLNNYVDSGKFRISSKSNSILLTKLLQMRNDNYIVHLGTKHDALSDDKNYRDIVDLDLRGLTTPEDIFSLMAMSNAYSVYCYDTFILHVANIFDVGVNVMFKKYFLYNEQKRKAFTSLFIKKDFSNINYL